VRELIRRVHSDACVELDTNRYSVPWRLIGEAVTVVVADRQVRVLYAGQEVACHAQSPLRPMTVIERSHLSGIVGAQPQQTSTAVNPGYNSLNSGLNLQYGTLNNANANNSNNGINSNLMMNPFSVKVCSVFSISCLENMSAITKDELFLL
jgi:hypothetical protein